MSCVAEKSNSKLEPSDEYSKDHDISFSDESQERHKWAKRLGEHYFTPMSRRDIDCLLKFWELKEQWKECTAKLSSSAKIAMHPAYQQIIGMGQEAIPLILAEMRCEPDHWFWALKSITGGDPVLPKQKGRLKEMTKSWINWGIEQDYIDE